MTTRTKNKTLFLHVLCVCERNSAQKIQFPQSFRSFFFFRLSRFLMFTDVIVSTGRLFGSRMFWGRNLLWKFYLYYYFTISTNFEIWDEICWISFLFWVSTIEDGCDFLLRGHDPDPGWPPSLLRWRWMTFTVCVCVCIKRMRITKWLTFLFLVW